MNKRLGFVTLLSSSVLFSTYGIFSRYLSLQLSVFQQLSYRYFLGIFVVLFIIFIIKRKSLDLSKFLNRNILMFSIVIPFGFYFFIRSFVESKLSVSISGFYAGTIASSLLIKLAIMKEKMNRVDITGIFLLVVAFIFLNDFDFQAIVNIGLLWGLISGILYGIASYIKKVSKIFSKEELLLVIAVSATVVMQAFSFLFHEALVFNLTSLTILSLLTFVAIALIAEYLTIVGFQNFDLYIGSIILSLEILFTIVVGMAMFHEYPTLLELIGVFLVLIAVIETNMPQKSFNN